MYQDCVSIFYEAECSCKAWVFFRAFIKLYFTSRHTTAYYKTHVIQKQSQRNNNTVESYTAACPI
jgi:hypothetical protein